MPYSPFEGFQVGQKVGKAKRSTFGMTSDTLLDTFNKEMQSNREISKLMAVEKFKKQNEIDVETKAAEKFLGGSQSGEFIPSEFKVGSMTLKNPKYTEDVKRLQTEAMVERELQKRKTVGVSADVAGRIASANEGIRALNDIKRIMYPDGTAKSFNLGAAFEAKPMVFGGKRAVPTYEGQTIARRSGQAMAGKLLVMSGVATNPQEYERIASQTVTNALNNPQSGLDSLDEAIRFYQEFLNAADPSSLYSNRADSAQDASLTSTPGQRTTKKGRSYSVLA